MQSCSVKVYVWQMVIIFGSVYFGRCEKCEKKELHSPGIEPGSGPWQGPILPLDQECSVSLVRVRYFQRAIYWITPLGGDGRPGPVKIDLKF